MSHVNGVSQQHPEPTAVAVPLPPEPNGNTGTSQARLVEIRQQLAEPFDGAEIKWRVTATATVQTKNGPLKRVRLIAYADQRAYTDRLNEVFGEWGWTRDYEVQVAQNFERRTNGRQEQTTVAAKVVVVSRVTIRSLGTHTGMGEEWADDENAATRAEAQAFKRACACFGLGRYLYDLGETWVDLDENNRPAYTPGLPEWALPKPKRGTAATNNNCGTSRKNQSHQRQGLVRNETLAAALELAGRVGPGLSRYVFQKYAGVTEPGKVGFAKLTMVLDKLTDIAKGIERLNKARTVVGDERFADICHDLSLANNSIDEIPDRATLAALLELVEAEADASERRQGERKTAGGIAAARGWLLQEARKAAERTGRRMGDLIEQASVGTLTLERLKDLMDANIAEVEKAASRLRSMKGGQ